MSSSTTISKKEMLDKLQEYDWHSIDHLLVTKLLKEYEKGEISIEEFRKCSRAMGEIFWYLYSKKL